MKNRVHRYILFFLFGFGVMLTVNSCGNDDDFEIDEAWKDANENAFRIAENSGNYNRWFSYASTSTPNVELSDDYILWKPSSTIDDEKAGKPKISVDGKPQFNDSVRCRYEGWFYDLDNKKIIFDSTENPVEGSNTNPNHTPRGFKISSVVEGWRTALQNMKAGEEVEIVIPWKLAYGAYSSGSIPGFTTLYFVMKLEEIVPMKETN
ncbi:MAG: FKBP-type peptidyl-prolyl cis-trans isomerase [Dysgonomonas sp.]